ncbi:MAG: hypothetical protein ACFB21_01505 [Opitutales bacterium]
MKACLFAPPSFREVLPCCLVLALAVCFATTTWGQTQEELLDEMREPLPPANDPHAITVLNYYREATTPAAGTETRPRMLRLTGTRRMGRDSRDLVLTASAKGQLHEQEIENLRFATKLLIRAFDGQNGWQHNPEWRNPKNRPLSGGLTEGFLDDYRYLFPIDWLGEFVRYDYRGRVRKIEPPRVLVRAYRKDGRYADITFTSRGYLPVKIEWKELYRGTIVERSWHFTRWEKAGLYWVPRQIDIRLADRSVGTIMIEDVEWDPGVPENLFTMPPTRTILLTNELGRQQRAEQNAGEGAAQSEGETDNGPVTIP